MSDVTNAFDALGINDEPVEIEQDLEQEDSGSKFEEVAEASGVSDQDLANALKDGAPISDEPVKVSSGNAQDEAKEANEQIEEQLVNMLKARHGEKEYEIAEDALFTVKVDGEELDVSLNDLRSNFSGKTSWDKKFSELDTERKAYLEDKQNVEKYVNEFAERAASGDKMAAMELLATISGQDALQFRRDLRTQVMEELMTRQGMNQDQIKALELEEELNFIRGQKESEQQQLTASQTNLEVQNQVTGIQETYDLSDEKLVGLYDAVVEKYGSNLSDTDMIQALDQEATYGIANDGAEYLLGNVSSDLINSENTQAVAELIINNPDFTEEDFMDIIGEAFGGSKKSNKKTSKKVKSATEPKQVTQSDLNLKNYTSFDDL